MATTTITEASFQTACAECADAIATSTWATAISWYARAEAINAGMPLSGEAGEHKMARRESLRGLRDAIAAAESAAGRLAGEDRLVTVRTGFNS